jgi:hypothetical protein
MLPFLYTESLARPFRRRRANTLRPPRVAMRALKPILLFRFRLDG